MTIHDLAKRIPAEVRSQRLLTEADPIMNANAVSTDPQMILLAEIWYSYIEPYADRSYCPVCLNNILRNMRAMRPELQQLESVSQTLNLL
jgi:hypothetical protein